MDDPPGEVDDGREDGPDRELPHEPSYEPDRAEQRQHGGERSEGQLPEPDRLEAEQLVAEQAGGGGDHDQFEDCPAEALHDVERRGEIGAAPPEWRALQHHRRHARIRADEGGEREHDVSDQAADERRGERIPERKIEVRR